MTLRNEMLPAGVGLKGKSLRRDDTPQERDIFAQIIDAVGASEDGLTNKELGGALDQPLAVIQPATYRLLSKGKLKINSPRPHDPLRFVLASWASTLSEAA